MNSEEQAEFNKSELTPSCEITNRGEQYEVAVREAPVRGNTNANTPYANAQMWAQYGSNLYAPCEKASSTLEPGQYTIEHNDHIGIHFKRAQVTLDSLIELPDSASEQVIYEIETFWKKEQHFRKFGFLWKRGVMLWGPPGSGKTSTLQQVSKRIIENGGLSVYVGHPGLASKGLAMLRQVEPNRPLVVMIEDIDAIIHNFGESDLLALLDGELQIDNVVFIATTNYPERLDKRFKNRPSRFDTVKKIGMPSDDARRVFLTLKNPRLALAEHHEELGMWVRHTKGFSVAHLKELVVSVEVFEVPFDESIQRLRNMIDISPSSDDKESPFGFIG